MLFLFAYESLHHCRMFDCKYPNKTSWKLCNQQLNIRLLLRYLRLLLSYYLHRLHRRRLKRKTQLQSLQATATKKDNVP